MEAGTLGRQYRDGEVVVKQGDEGDCMYVIQAGRVEVLRDEAGKTVQLAILEVGDIFGEMALFERESRSATVKALGDTRVLTVDKKMFLRRAHEDPSLAFRILQRLSHRIRVLGSELARIKSQQ